MYQCLTIVEIVEIIFEYIDGHDYLEGLPQINCREESALRTLAALACTCKTFRDVAQDVLWREIPDIFILIRYLFPRKVRNYRASERTLYLTSKATTATWDRLDKFIPRIRLIGRRLPYLNAARCLLDGPSVLQPLQDYLHRKYGGTFPNLIEVYFQYHWSNPVYVRLLLHPQILTVRFPLDTFGDETQDDGPGHIDRGDIDEIVKLSIIDALPGMRALKKVWVQDELLSEPSFMSYLASLPTLEELCVDSHYSFPDARVPQTTRRFCSLRSLYLTGLGSTSDVPCVFLSSIEPASLESLTFMWIHSYSEERTGVGYLRNFISTLSTIRALRLQHLRATYCRDERDLTMFLIDYGMPPGSLRSISKGAKYLRSLCDLTSLRSIELEIDVVILLSDDFLLQLASSLPHLERLILVPGILYAFKLAEEAELPTFKGLLALVEHCPRLTVLRLAVRTAFKSTGDSGDNSGLPPPALLSSDAMQILDLFATPVEYGVDPRTVSAFIMFTFPNLERFRVVLPAVGSGTYSMEERVDACRRWTGVMEDILTAERAAGKDVDRAKWYVR